MGITFVFGKNKWVFQKQKNMLQGTIITDEELTKNISLNLHWFNGWMKIEEKVLSCLATIHYFF